MATHIGIIGRRQLLFQGTPADLHRRTRDSVLITVERADQAAKALSQTGWRVTPAADGNLLVEVESPDAAADVNAVLVRSGFRVTELRLQRPSLEELFLQLTTGMELGRRAA